MSWKGKRRVPRGAQRFSWTYGDLSTVTGLSRKTLYNYRSAGRFDPARFPTVINFLLEIGVDERTVATAVLDASTVSDGD